MTYDINSNILTKSGLTAGQLETAEKALSPDNAYHPDFWQALVDAENAYDLNALFILAHADIESAHGKSNYAEQRNNLFGFNAVDSNPDLASAYSSQAVSVHDYADFLSSHYLKEGEEYYGGPSGDSTGVSAHSIFVHYSSSHDTEAEEVVGIMNTLEGHVSGNPAPAFTPAPTSTPSSQTYEVKSGESMSSIAAAHGISLGTLEGLNPHAGHPAGNFGVIWPGDKLTVEGNNATPPAIASPQYVTVASGQNLSTIAEEHNTSLAYIEALNPNAGHPARNFDVIWVGDQIRVK